MTLEPEDAKEDAKPAVAPIPWEQSGEALALRYLRTLASAFRPIHSAPSFAHSDQQAALRFLLLSALPLALLAGIIPHTRTLLFAGNFSLRVLNHASSQQIALDVARAAATQVLLTSIEFGCLVLPYASLVRAYAKPERAPAAVAMLFYRIWLMPAALLACYMAVFALPAINPAVLSEAPPLTWMLVDNLPVLGRVLLMLSMLWTARFSCGLGPGMSLVVVLVPMLLMMLVEPLANAGVNLLLPSMPQLQAAP